MDNKITIFGCSVAIRVRPPENFPQNRNYGMILENLLDRKYPETCNLVKNFGFSRATILEIVEKLENYIVTFPDYFILNIGVPDASTREIPYWFAQIINKQNDSLLKKVFSVFHAKFIKKHNAFFVKLRGKKTWVSSKKFKSDYNHILSKIKKETNARVICLAISPTNSRVESKIPGSTLKYQSYNKIIEKLASKFDADFIDFDDLLSEKCFPDGIHFSGEGHRIVAERIFNVIEGYKKRQSV